MSNHTLVYNMVVKINNWFSYKYDKGDLIKVMPHVGELCNLGLPMFALLLASGEG